MYSISEWILKSITLKKKKKKMYEYAELKTIYPDPFSCLTLNLRELFWWEVH